MINPSSSNLRHTKLVRAQANPAAATITDLYYVPNNRAIRLNTIMIANRSAIPTAFRISIAPNGDVDNLKQYCFYDVPIEGNQTLMVDFGVDLASSDTVRVYATLATLSFSLFGAEL